MMPAQLISRTEKYMMCNFDHFLLGFHMLVVIVSHKMGNNGKHACGGIESIREEICGIIFCKWKNPPVEECDQ